jgi:hypothetical protein
MYESRKKFCSSLALFATVFVCQGASVVSAADFPLVFMDPRALCRQLPLQTPAPSEDDLVLFWVVGHLSPDRLSEMLGDVVAALPADCDRPIPTASRDDIVGFLLRFPEEVMVGLRNIECRSVGHPVEYDFIVAVALREFFNETLQRVLSRVRMSLPLSERPGETSVAGACSFLLLHPQETRREIANLEMERRRIRDSEMIRVAKRMRGTTRTRALPKPGDDYGFTHAWKWIVDSEGYLSVDRLRGLIKEVIKLEHLPPMTHAECTRKGQMVYYVQDHLVDFMRGYDKLLLSRQQ